ncbi:MAG: aminotransferase class I/II-fold pyridoxal phosphate-dependent enzyme [Oscillospiraceae bacterium]|nr:aminotransferase class I/II-fold pyridoxal phosphate-dependent enzyme [Oscillospiraceae bacterium]
MAEYLKMEAEELEHEFSAVRKKYNELLSLNLSLDMSRGKPNFDNMDLCDEVFTAVTKESGYKTLAGVDCRNYGGMDGLPEAKALFAEIFGVEPSQVIVGGNSSLSMMFDTVAQGMTHGFGEGAWGKQDNIKFICPAPGYDRHFAVTEHFGIELLYVPMTENGPDMDMVEELCRDASVKGMWCVPKYSNPEGITFSDETVRRMAALKPAAKDFRIFWDNAYAVHDLYDEGDDLLNIYDECVKAGNPDLVFMFTSTSKITFPGAGIAAQAASPNNIAMIKSRLQYQTIGPDKLNQLRHLRFLPDMAAVKNQMKKHAEILRPKFESVLEELEKQLFDTGIARWTKPRGGYFISLYVLEGTAKRVEELCKAAGMVLTPAGATYPYGKDPYNSNIRIAPSFPSVEEIKKAAEVLCVAVRYAALEKLIGKC